MLGLAGRGASLLWNVAKFPFKHWILSSAVVADEVVFEGAGRKKVGEVAVDGAKTAWDYATDDKKREEIGIAYNEGVKGIRATKDDIVEVAKDPMGAGKDYILGGKDKDGNQKPGVLSKAFGLFKDDDGSVNWLTTGLTAAGGLFGASKLFGKGKDAEGGGFGWMKMLMMAAVAVATVTHWKEIKEFAQKTFGNISDKFNEKSGELGSSLKQSLNVNPSTGLTGTFDLSKIATPRIGGAPAAGVSTSALGTTFSTNVAGPSPVAPTEKTTGTGNSVENNYVPEI